MKSYREYCGLAKALDVIGDRWTLLIIRELLIRGPCRYTDLRDGLPGIATNLLADRMRELEKAGIVSREDAPPPIPAALFELTKRGKELEAVVDQIGRWGGQLVGKRKKGDAFRSHWIALPIKLHLKVRIPIHHPIAIELHCGEEPMVIEAVGRTLHVREGSAQKSDLVLRGTPELMVAVITRRMTIDQARASGLRIHGDFEVLERLLPRASS